MQGLTWGEMGRRGRDGKEKGMNTNKFREVKQKSKNSA